MLNLLFQIQSLLVHLECIAHTGPPEVDEPIPADLLNWSGLYLPRPVLVRQSRNLGSTSILV